MWKEKHQDDSGYKTRIWDEELADHLDIHTLDDSPGKDMILKNLNHSIPETLLELCPEASGDART